MSEPAWKIVSQASIGGGLRPTAKPKPKRCFVTWIRKALWVLATLGALFLFQKAMSGAWNARAVPATAGAPTYVVQPYDTPWSVAVQLDPQWDPRSVTDWIQQHNHLADGEILRPGQVIIIPKR